MSVAAAAFAVFAASQIGTPGPANMALMATGARHGFVSALPFVAGVVLGKQIIIWPLGFGLAEVALAAPVAFSLLKWMSAGYICWLAWRVAGMRLSTGEPGPVPGFWAGLIVHPLNPKAWGMIITGFTGFVAAGTAALEATAIIAAILLVCQMVFHPIWTVAGARIAAVVAGTATEPYLMRILALLTVGSVAIVLFSGDL